MIGLRDTLLFRSRFLLGGLFLLAEEGRDLAAQRFALRFCLVVGEFLRAGEAPVSVQLLHGLLLRVAEIRRAVGTIGSVICERRPDIRSAVIPRHLIALYTFIDKSLILRARLGAALLRCTVGELRAADLHIDRYARPVRSGQEFSQVRCAAFCVLVEHLLEEFIGLCPLAVFQRHLPAVEQRLHVAARLVMYHDCLFDSFGHSLLRLCRIYDFFDTPDEILNKSNPAHILTLQHTEFFRHIIRVHIAVAGDEQAAAVGAHEREIPAPFVPDPDGVQVFRLRADHDHDLRRMQGGEDIRLVFLSKLVLQRDTRKEDLIARVGELVINILRQRGILCAPAVLVGFLVADEHVERRFLLRDRQNVLLQRRNALRLLFVQTPRHAVGVLQRGLIVHVVQNAVKARAVTGRDALAGGRVLHILDAIPAEQQVPVRLRVRVVLADQPLVDRRSLVKFTVPPQMRTTVE